MLGLLGIDCGAERLGTGKRCERNSECGAPLVCRLARCRRECNTTRDCGTGLTCLFDATGIGSCQLPAETSCTRASDCVAPLVCRFTQCVNVCNEDIDCPAGSSCMADSDGANGCVDSSGRPCVRHEECAATGQTCALDGRCRDECVNDRDCRFGTTCCAADLACHGPGECARVTPRDAGPRDSGMTDAGAPDGGDAGPAPPSLDLVAAACGGDVTCGLDGSGRVLCWGRNDRGQLGRGTMTPSEPTPEAVALDFAEPDSDAIRVVCSGDACCAIRAAALFSAELRCWGSIADSATGAPMESPTPFTIAALSGLPIVYGVSMRDGSFCADTGNASAVHQTYCWGDNTEGQLGDGTTTTPRAIALLPDVFGVQLGAGFACGQRGEPGALTGIDCWGRNDEGQLGRDVTSTREPTPAAAITSGHFGNARGGVSLGRAHACALDGANGIVCWGRGDEGQIGDGLFADSLHGVSPGIAASVLACGGDMCCASDGAGGGTFCWGTGPLGSAGATVSGVPIPITAPATGERLDPACVGRAHACALDDSTPRRLFCWGDNTFGQLGLPTTTPSSDVPIASAR